MSVEQDQHAPLRDNVRLLGEELGAVLREQSGERLYDTVETIRQLTGQANDTQVNNAQVGLISGFGMINYDRGLCTAAAILARSDT